jgi:Uma2 family endonuclease
VREGDMIPVVMGPRFTRADYARLPEGFPAQLVRGSLVKEPSPTYGHQRLVHLLLERLSACVGRDRVVPAPMDVGLDDHNVYQPDVVVLRDVPDADVRDVGIPWIVVEVLSPSTARLDREVKATRLLAAGVAEVWLVDPRARTIERRDASGAVIASSPGEIGDVASTAIPGFRLSLADLF